MIASPCVSIAASRESADIPQLAANGEKVLFVCPASRERKSARIHHEFIFGYYNTNKKRSNMCHILAILSEVIFRDLIML